MTSQSGPAVRLTRQTWLALVSACAFVVLALLIALSPVPYVVYSPGRAYDVLGVDDQGRPLLSIEGTDTFPTHGKLHMTTVAMTRSDANTSLPEAILAYWLPKRDALPRDAVYDPGKTSDQVRAEERLMMDTSQQDAVVAALRAADQPVEALPVVSSVTVSAPAHGRLQPGDLILAVDGVSTSTPGEVRDAIRSGAVGEVMTITVERDRRTLPVEVRTSAGNSDPKVPVIGIEIGIGYRYAPRVHFGVDDEVGGPSAGLVFAVALYDQITPEDLLRARSVAGTGDIDADGRVGPIGGLQQKIASAEGVGATVFLVPAGNCRDLAGLRTSLELIRVDTLDDAITGLRYAGSATADRVPRC
jgi:PDZ domain-containing protein